MLVDLVLVIRALRDQLEHGLAEQRVQVPDPVEHGDRSGFAAEPLKVGFVYLGAIGDYGWTWSHEQGRKALDAALKGQVATSYVENVKEDASAVPVMKDLAQQGNKLIFTTSYGYMDQTLEAAKQFTAVRIWLTEP